MTTFLDNFDPSGVEHYNWKSMKVRTRKDVSVVYCKRKRNILWNVRVFKASSRRWNSSHVPYDSTNIPEKIYIPYIPNSKMPNAKWIKKKGRSPIDPQVQSKGAEREKVRAGRKPKQAIFPGCRRSEKGQRTEGPRASDIRTGERRSRIKYRHLLHSTRCS